VTSAGLPWRAEAVSKSSGAAIASIGPFSHRLTNRLREEWRHNGKPTETVRDVLTKAVVDEQRALEGVRKRKCAMAKRASGV